MRRLTRHRLGQTTIEYTLIVAVVAVPFSYAMWYFFFHGPTPGSQGRLIQFLSLVTDFATW